MPTTRRGFMLGGVGAAIAGASAVGASVQSSSRNSSGIARSADLPVALAGDGVTDDGPAIQAAYDAGVSPLVLEGAKTYLINTPIFLDQPDTYAMFVIELNGATLRLGDRLPRTSSFGAEPDVTWAVFPNTKRSAWNASGGSVKTSEGTRATGDVGALLSLVVRNGTIDGQGRKTAFAFSNRTGCRFEGVVLLKARALLSWTDYCDANVLEGCHNRAGGPRNSVLVEQVSSGDGLRVSNCKSDAAVGLLRLKYCRGAEIEGSVTSRIELEACSAVRIHSAHQEAQISDDTILIIRSSNVTIDSSAFYLPREPAGQEPPSILIDDSQTTGASTVTFVNSIEMRSHEFADTGFGALLSITPKTSTTVEFQGVASKASAMGKGGQWPTTVGPTVVSADAGLAAALAANQATVGSGSFLVEYTGGAWAVLPRYTRKLPAQPAAASFRTVEDTLDVKKGSLSTSSSYGYVAVAVDAAGGVSPAASSPATKAGSGKVIKIIADVDAQPCTLRIWRTRSGQSAPDGYVELACGVATVTLYDTGNHVAGIEWGKQSIPALPSG